MVNPARMDSDHDAAPRTGNPVLALEGIAKSYGATRALDGAGLRLWPGRVHALLGENGAGKSTLVKLMSGLVHPSAGSISIFGRPASLGSPRAAHSLDIQTAFQEMTLVPDLTVLENMLLPYAPVGPTGLISKRAARRSVEAHIADLGFSVDLDAIISNLELSVRQKIEIARAAAESGGLRQATFDVCDLSKQFPQHRGSVALLDVLQYFDADVRDELLSNAARCVTAEGRLILRAGLNDGGWRAALTRGTDRAGHLLRWMKTPPRSQPTIADLAGLLRHHGLQGEFRPLWGRTPFNNWLVVAARA